MSKTAWFIFLISFVGLVVIISFWVLKLNPVHTVEYQNISSENNTFIKDMEIKPGVEIPLDKNGKIEVVDGKITNFKENK